MKKPGGGSTALGLVVTGILALGAHGLARYEGLRLGTPNTAVYIIQSAPAPENASGWEGLLFSRKLDANAATEEDWRALPFVGKRTASSIMQTRERLGGFESYEQFLQVSGIGPKRFEKLKKWVEIRTTALR